jgi:hypothetical protein
MNKGRSLRVLLGVGAMAAGIVLVCGSMTGCTANTGSSSSSQSTLKPGLNILSADPHVGVSAAYVANGRTVYVQTNVGKLKEQLYREKFPNEPQYEIDSRAVDEEGRTFIVVIAGDNLIDPSWASDWASQKPISSAAEGVQRQADFVLARDAVNALATQLSPEFADHMFHLTNMTRVLPQESPRLQARAHALEATMPSERTFTANGCGSNYQEGWLFAKSFEIIAQHSSVEGWNYNGCSGSWDEQVVTCNHGTCANDGSMGYQCGAYGNWGYNALLDYWSRENNTSTNNSYNTGACWSGYGIDVADITVYGSGDPNHECNDDSALEMQEIYNHGYIPGNSFSENGYNCYFTSHWYGPLDSSSDAPTNMCNGS